MHCAPFHIWLLVMSAQPHKEERFLYVVYPLACFNAAVTLFLAREWLVTLLRMADPAKDRVVRFFRLNLAIPP